MNFSAIQRKEKRPTIDRAKFKRIMGPIHNTDFSIEFDPKRESKCKKSFISGKSKPLTVR